MRRARPSQRHNRYLHQFTSQCQHHCSLRTSRHADNSSLFVTPKVPYAVITIASVIVVVSILVSPHGRCQTRRQLVKVTCMANAAPNHSTLTVGGRDRSLIQCSLDPKENLASFSQFCTVKPSDTQTY